MGAPEKVQVELAEDEALSAIAHILTDKTQNASMGHVTEVVIRGQKHAVRHIEFTTERIVIETETHKFENQ